LSQKVLVIGSGFLGSNVANNFKSTDFSVIETNLSKIQTKSYPLDITNAKNVQTFFKRVKPDIVINCSGNTNIDFLEENPDLAYSINGIGVQNLAIASKEIGSRLIQISTDGIFDGKYGNYNEDDKPKPVNIYAKSKVLGEQKTIENCDNYVVIRTNFYGHHPSDRYLFNSVLANLKRKKSFIGFDDVVFTPLEVNNLAQLILDIAISNYVGILNLSSDKAITKYEFCFHVANVFGFDTKLIKQGSIDEMGFVAKRPKNTSLDNKRAKNIIKHKIILLTDWLQQIKHSIEFTDNNL